MESKLRPNAMHGMLRGVKFRGGLHAGLRREECALPLGFGSLG